MRQAEAEAGPGYSGIGTTLSANALQLHCMRANLSEVMTPANYKHMLDLSERLARGVEKEIAQRNVPWHVSNVGARAEFVCAPTRPKNGAEAKAAMRPHLELAVHLYLLNRGVLIAPFHNMTLLSRDHRGAGRSSGRDRRKLPGRIEGMRLPGASRAFERSALS